MYDQTPQEEKAPILTQPQIQIIIPQCCRENWPDCPHQTRREKKTKKNIGM